MTKLILWILGLALLASSVALLLKPQLLRECTEKMGETGYRFGAWVAVIIGLILLLIADTRSWVTVIKALGVISVLKGAWLLHAGFPRGRDLLMKPIADSEILVRMFAGFGVVIALLLFSVR